VPDAEDIRRILDDAVAALQQAAPDAETAQIAELRGEGSAGDGLVTTVAAPGGRVESVFIHPRAMRLDSQTLAEHITTAVNAALDDLTAKVADTAATPVADSAALLRRLQEVQIASVERLNTFLRTINEAHR
jgi:DNA-binding protein YbaB